MLENHVFKSEIILSFVLKLLFVVITSFLIAFETKASVVCVTGDIVMNGQVIAQTTICYIREGAEEGPTDDGTNGPTGGGPGGGSIVTIKEDIGRTYMPPHKREVSCSDTWADRRSAAQAAFAKWKLAQPNLYVRNRTTPDFKNYRIHFDHGGTQVFKWQNSFYSSSFFVKVSECQ